jgi:hypothetical protein
VPAGLLGPIDYFSALEFDRKAAARKILLVFQFHWPSYHNQLILIPNKYLPLFRGGFHFPVDCVFYGPVANYEEGVLSYGLRPNGYYSSHTLSLAIRHLPGYRGYIQLNDDSFVNPYVLNFHDFTRVLIQPLRDWRSARQWPWIYRPNVRRIPAYDALMNIISDICSTAKYNRSALCLRPMRQIYYGFADFFYIPKEYSRPYVELEAYCMKHWVFLELCVPTVASISRLSLQRYRPRRANESVLRCLHLHPVKYSNKGARDSMVRLFSRIRMVERTGFYQNAALGGQCISQVSGNDSELIVNDPYY